MLTLAEHGPDVHVGTGPAYPWGGLYGGQIVAQALRAASSTVDERFRPHSLRAYFIRTGDAAEPVRYEVDRIRNGKSFCTRRVVARQAVGAILNLEASFQVHEPTGSKAIVPCDPVPHPDELGGDSWSTMFVRRKVPGTDERGRVRSWFRMVDAVGDDPCTQACALAYLSDDMPTEAVLMAEPMGPSPGGTDADPWPDIFSVSLDHTIWFHRPVDADQWHLHDFSCHGFSDGRGLALGHVFSLAGEHLATVAQEVLIRRRRQ